MASHKTSYIYALLESIERNYGHSVPMSRVNEAIKEYGEDYVICYLEWARKEFRRRNMRGGICAYELPAKRVGGFMEYV